MREETFSRWIRRQLDRREWSQADLARKLNVSPSVVNRWLLGTRIPSPAYCDLIADALSVDLDIVLFQAGHRPMPKRIDPDDPKLEIQGLVDRVDWSVPAIRAAIDRVIAGDPINAVAAQMNAEGITTINGGFWHPSTLRTLLMNPALAGGITTVDGIRWDSFAGLVTRAEWDQLQHMIMARRRLKSGVKVEHWLRGHVYHGCGQRMILDRVITRSGNEHLYFRCPNEPSRVREGKCPYRPSTMSARRLAVAVMDALSTDLESVISPDDAISAWNDNHNGKATIKRRTDLIRELAKVTAGHERAEALYINGSRNAAWLAEQDATFNDRRIEIEAELSRLDTAPDRNTLRASNVMLLGVRDMLRMIDGDQASTLLSQLGRVVIMERTVHIEYRDTIASLIPRPSVVSL